MLSELHKLSKLIW